MKIAVKMKARSSGRTSGLRSLLFNRAAILMKEIRAVVCSEREHKIAISSAANNDNTINTNTQTNSSANNNDI